ncbi:MAG: chemotaxis protein CheB [Actinomycetota bacterium]|nr:chemotaxis protein CheB [Actinomycetota bacterium]
MRRDLVVVGSSWGGLDAVGQLLAGLPPGFAAAVAIAQHRSPGFEDGTLAALLGARGALAVREAEDKDPIEPGRAYLAPADYHLLVDPEGFALSIDEHVQYSRPSVDVLFESAADAYGERAVAVVLTGANADGAAGVEAVRARGGVAIAQDPDGAERAEMPRAAIATGAVERVLPLPEIAPFLVELCGVR